MVTLRICTRGPSSGAWITPWAGPLLLGRLFPLLRWWRHQSQQQSHIAVTNNTNALIQTPWCGANRTQVVPTRHRFRVRIDTMREETVENHSAQAFEWKPKIKCCAVCAPPTRKTYSRFLPSLVPSPPCSIGPLAAWSAPESKSIAAPSGAGTFLVQLCCRCAHPGRVGGAFRAGKPCTAVPWLPHCLWRKTLIRLSLWPASPSGTPRFACHTWLHLHSSTDGSPRRSKPSLCRHPHGLLAANPTRSNTTRALASPRSNFPTTPNERFIENVQFGDVLHVRLLTCMMTSQSDDRYRAAPPAPATCRARASERWSNESLIPWPVALVPGVEAGLPPRSFVHCTRWSTCLGSAVKK